MFELAKDHLHRMGNYQVIGGIISPVHDAYGKKGLLESKHRLEMVGLAVGNDSWVKLSAWEASQNNIWTRTRKVLEYHQTSLDRFVKEDGSKKEEWMPDMLESNSSPVLIKLLCGADVLESFNTPGLWSVQDMQAITKEYGIVTITRAGNDPLKSIHLSDCLFENMKNIFIVREWVPNEISSTEVRRARSRGQSVRYLVPDAVIRYMEKEKLYTTL
jgi:nicotinamide mononucleotide adenylyltransferase